MIDIVDIEKAYKEVAFRATPLFQLPLKDVYEYCCEEYRSRLCKMWGFDIADSYWIPTNRVGEVVAICDGEYTFGMEDLRYFVENNTSFEDFSEWWRYNLVNPKRQINAYSWSTLGARPEILKDNEETQD